VESAESLPEIPIAIVSFDILDYRPVFDMETGALNLATVYRIGVWGSGLLLDLIPIEETDFWSKAAGISLRLLKGSLLDVNLDMLAFLLQHEYFGHGARHRELTGDYSGTIIVNFGISRWWNIFPPFIGLLFANGGSFTSTVPLQAWEDAMAFQTGGSEGDYIMAAHGEELMLRSKRLDYSLCLHYLDAHIYNFIYIWNSLRDETVPGFPGFSDYEYYIYQINQAHGYTDPAGYPFKSSMLRNADWWNLIDPFLFYSLVSVYWYVWSGEQQLDMWLPEIRGVRFLPSIYVNTAYFGLDSYFFLKGILQDDFFYQVYVRWGDGIFYSIYDTLGFGLKVSMLDPDAVFQGCTFDCWIQPVRGNVSPGFSASVDINPHAYGNHIKLGAGFKTEGYLMGRPIDLCGFGRITISF
jgi:hypothetical protein